MIFNNYLTEKEIVEKMIKESNYDYGFIFRIDYVEDENGCIQEGNINSDLVGAPNKKGNSRYIMITSAGSAKHPGRMKVSKPGSQISRSTSYNDYIEIYRKNATTITYDGNIKNINMKNKELDFYINLFIENENLIQFIRFNNGQYDDYIDSAFVRDIQARMSGLIVNRDRNGNAEIYNINGAFLYRENIKGEKI